MSMKSLFAGIVVAGLLAVPLGAFGLELNNAYNTNLTGSVVVDSLVKNQGGTLSITNNGGVYTLTVTTAPTNINGIIPWAIINDSSAPGGSILNWAVGNGAGNALSSYTAYVTTTDFGTWLATDNARPTGSLGQGSAICNSLILGPGMNKGSNGQLITRAIFQTGGTSIFERNGGYMLSTDFGSSEGLLHILGTLIYNFGASNQGPAFGGTGGVTKSGSGTMVFGVNDGINYQNTGPLTINEGTFRVQSSLGSALGGGAVALVLNGGQLSLGCESALDFTRNATVNGDFSIVSDRYTASSAGVTYTLAALAITNCTLTVAGGANVNSGTAGLTFSGATTLSGSPTFHVTNPAAGGITLLTLGGAIGDGGNGYGFTKTGDGTLALSGTNSTFLGAATVSAGVLALTTNTCLHDGAALRIVTGAKVDLAAGVNETVKALYLDGQLKMAGTWGNTGSGAQFEKPLYFAGSGILTSLTGTPKGTIMLVR